MKFMLIVLGILIINFSSAQRIEDKANKLKYDGELKLAILEYVKIYNKNPNDKIITYEYARVLALDNQIDSAFNYLKIAVLNDSIGVRAPIEPDFYYLIEDQRWEEIENKVIENIEDKYDITYEDADLSKELWRMKIKQRAYIYHLNLVRKLNGNNSSIIIALNRIKENIDKENLEQLEKIVKEKGWPKKSIVKETAATAALSLILEADYPIQKKYLSLIKKAVDSDEANSWQLAYLIDIVNIKEGKKQIYGTQFYQKEDGSWYVKDLLEPEFVNQRRKEVGLQPIDDELFIRGIYWHFKQNEK